MGLTLDEFVQLTGVIANLLVSIYSIKGEDNIIEINEKNRRIATAAQSYRKFFSDLRYVKFMDLVRKSLKIL